MIRNLVRGLLAAALLGACSDVTSSTAPLAPGAAPVRTLGLSNAATADTLVVGETLQLTEALPRRRGKTVATATTWTSSNPTAATVSAQGLVTARATGSTVVTARNSLAAESATILVVAAAAPAPTPAPAPAPAPTPAPAANGTLVNAATGLCLAVAGDRNATGVAVVLSACAGTAGQVWQGAAVGTPALLSVFSGAQCLDDWGAAGRAGDLLGTWTCVPGAPTQTWTLTDAGALKMANGLCVQGGSAGQQVTLQACTGTAAQQWTAGTGSTPTTEPAPTPAPAPAPSPTPTPTPAPTPTSTTPELPRVAIDTRMPTQTGRVIAVPAGGDLQAALNAAQPGDVVTLANGATYTGNFVLPNKTAGGWIVVRPADVGALPAEGTRLAPSRHAAQMPKIVSANAMFALATPDAYANTGTRGWRLVGLEIASNPANAIAQAIVELGTGSETSTATLASHIVLDRVWIHGRAEQYVPRCLSLNSAHTAVIDSYLSDCHTRGGEGQVIGGWTTPGPLKIENNYLEGGTIGMLIGGADPRIQGLIPSDITVRRNHFFKPLSWKGVWSVKNSFELKNAQRVLLEGNVFENNWMDAQSGYMILFTPLSQDNLAPWTTVRDVTFRHNVLRNSDQGFMISARNAYGSNAQTLTDVTKRILIEHNVLDRIGGRTFMVYNETQDVTIAHNVVNSAAFGMLLLEDPTKAPAQRLVMRDNLISRGWALVNGDGTGQGTAALSVYATDAVIAGNLAYSSIEAGLGPVWLYPSTTTFVADAAQAGITSATINGVTVAHARVSSTSAYYRAGTGGSTPGADLTAVESATAGVVQP